MNLSRDTKRIGARVPDPRSGGDAGGEIAFFEKVELTKKPRAIGNRKKTQPNNIEVGREREGICIYFAA